MKLHFEHIWNLEAWSAILVKLVPEKIGNLVIFMKPHVEHLWYFGSLMRDLATTNPPFERRSYGQTCEGCPHEMQPAKYNFAFIALGRFGCNKDSLQNV